MGLPKLPSNPAFCRQVGGCVVVDVLSNLRSLRANMQQGGEWVHVLGRFDQENVINSAETAFGKAKCARIVIVRSHIEFYGSGNAACLFDFSHEFLEPARTASGHYHAIALCSQNLGGGLSNSRGRTLETSKTKKNL